MNKHMVIGVILGGVVATAGGAFALRDSGPKIASIIAVVPITQGMEQEYAQVANVQQRINPNTPLLAEVVSTQPIIVAGQTREVCEDQIVTHQAPVKDTNQIAGTATGAVIGGLLGNQVGGGNGKKAATVLGAIAGGVVGKNVQANRQQQQTYQTTEQVCNTQRDPDRTVGYDVQVTINGQPQNLTMDYQPRGQLPVVNGQVITDKAQIKQLKASMPAPVYEVTYIVNNQTQLIPMSYAPTVGERFPIENGQVLTTQEQIADLEARSGAVVAYKVMYQSEDGIGETRMSQQPVGNTLALKHGKPVVTASAQ